MEAPDRHFVTNRDFRSIKSGNKIKIIQIYRESELHHWFGDYPENEVTEVVVSKPENIIIKDSIYSCSRCGNSGEINKTCPSFTLIL